jgi:RNA polymerase sigma-70 factor (ECF subfamily)
VAGESTREQTLDLNRYLNGLYGYACILCRNSTQAEDLVQETCLHAIRAKSTLRPDSNVKSWLFTILRNIWLNQLRHQRTVPLMVELDLETSEPRDTTPDPHTVYADKVEREQVRAAIQQLPVEFREIIVLREYEDLSYQEIAALLDCPIGTVMSRLARARSKLRTFFPATRVAPPRSQAENMTPTEEQHSQIDHCAGHCID